VQFLRAQSSAILSSAETILVDNPSLNVRLSRQDLAQQIDIRQPVRVVVDSKLRLSGKEKLFQTPGDIWIVTLNGDEKKTKQLETVGAEVIRLENSASEHICLNKLMQVLAARGINEVHTECGQSLAGALIDQQLADQIIIYMAPHLLGSKARGAFELSEITDMGQRKTCNLSDIRQFGEDLRLTLIPGSS
jgi:diaminohydroxyphosphoribosylaminopyrimidine deaminase/5-amino-6-(5-phosphoribosylamino)uracil reductase